MMQKVHLVVAVLPMGESLFCSPSLCISLFPGESSVSNDC